MSRRFITCVVAVACAFVLWAMPAGAVVIFSQGMQVPETISQIPEGYEPATPGDFLIPDAREGIIWSMPGAGGPPSVFAQITGDRTLGGLFLPESGWGEWGGQYIVVSSDTTNFNYGRIHAIAPDGTPSLVAQLDEGGMYFSVPLIAPASFGDLAGKLMISAQGNGIYTFDLDQGFTPFAQPPELGYFGMAFAPDDFGTVGGSLLVEIINGDLYSIAPDGTAQPFTSVPLYEGQGTRQMTFAPAGFLSSMGIDEQVLLISVAGSSDSSGPLGDVLAIDASGDVVASLRVADDLAKFNPRGLLIVDDQLLISDAADPIIMATASDFLPGRDANLIPEPAGLFLLSIGCVAAACRRRAQD